MAYETGPTSDQADSMPFWRGLWSKTVSHSEGPWMEVRAIQAASITPIDPVIITPEDVVEAVRRLVLLWPYKLDRYPRVQHTEHVTGRGESAY
ncbi:unnamed protein product [Parnassius apollo]|uniref:(apollo) hypothetical protein n=1 Tax=Parnassius apollo TaxID=110799 RepID=A0A8S3Y788_PARAO|nr:unnamed protein product [Parnassius apollo]